MKAMKDRDKCLKILQKELKKIRSRPTVLNVRRSVRRAGDLLSEIVDFNERYDSDLLSIQAVKIKNAYLARALQKERERSNMLLQEKNQLQAAFHDLRCEKIELRKDKSNLERILLSDIEDFKNTLPNIVELSELYSKKMMKYDAIKKNISSGRVSKISFGKNSCTPPVSAVNPMVKGCVIQKPTINVRRVPVSNETRSSMFEYVNINSPILEDNEEIASPATNLTRRCENGLRNVLNITSRRKAERLQQSVSTAEVNYSNDTVDDEQSNVLLEPVVRLGDVTRLLQHSSIRISETSAASPADQSRIRTSKSKQWSPEVLVPKIPTPVRPNLDLSDNPLEGCSWMYQRSSPNVHDDIQQSPFYGFQSKSFRSPLFPKSPFRAKRNSSGANLSKRKDSVPMTASKSPSSTIDADVVVSSSNVDMDGEILPVGITRRKRKHSLSSHSRSRSSSGSSENSVPNNVELALVKRTHHLRRSTRLSCRIGDTPDSSHNSILRESRFGNSSEIARTKNTTLNDSDISNANDTIQRRKKKKSRKNSKTNVNVSNVSNSDSDDSSVQSRPKRNRGVVNFKEPSLHTKLRRN